MARCILITFLFLGNWCFNVFGQDAAGFRLGVRGGLNLSRFSHTVTNNVFLRSYALGVALEYPVVRRLSIVSELIYSRQGNDLRVNNPSPMITKIVTKYDYILLPFLIRYQPPKTALLLCAGLQVGYLVRNETIFLPVRGYTNQADPLLRRWDSGILLGVGSRLGKQFLLDARYFESFSTVYRPYAGPDPTTGKLINLPAVQQFNQVISLNLSFYFNK